MSRTFCPRREFLRFLAASPLMSRAWAQDASAAGDLASPKDALSVMDFEPLARKALPPAHWGYMATGVDDDVTLRMNREAFEHYQLRARRLVDVTKADLKTDVFGATWDMPIYISAVGSQKAFHPEGELATARAAKAKKTMQMLSTVDLDSGGRSGEEPGHAALVSALHAGHVEGYRKAGEAGGGGRLSGTGLDHRSSCGAKYGDSHALHADGQAGLPVVPHQFPHGGPTRSEIEQADVRRAFRRDESAGSDVELRRSAEEADKDEAGPQRD